MKLLSERLSADGKPHWATWEPTDGAVGKLIRSMLARETPAQPCTMALLYAADRNEHLDGADGIRAHAARGDLILSDRYLFSSLAYQSVECGWDFVLALNGRFPLPECVVFLDTPVEVCQRRLARRGPQELFDGVEFQRRVRERYLEAFQRFQGSGMRIAVVNGDRPVEPIHAELWGMVAACR
jgi:dTMP kinase